MTAAVAARAPQQRRPVDGHTPRDLIARAQAGDATAVAGLYSRYAASVHRYARRRVASPALAEDITQETFLRAVTNLHQFTWQGRDPGAWLCRIARNLIADHYKSLQHRREIVAADPFHLHHEHHDGRSVVDPAELVPRRLERQAHTARVAALLRALPESQADVIRRRFLLDESVAAVAAAYGKTEGAVKALQYRATQRILRMGLLWLSNVNGTRAHATVDPVPEDLNATCGVLPKVRPLCSRKIGLVKPPSGDPLPRCRECESAAAAETGADQ